MQQVEADPNAIADQKPGQFPAGSITDPGSVGQATESTPKGSGKVGAKSKRAAAAATGTPQQTPKKKAKAGASATSASAGSGAGGTPSPADPKKHLLALARDAGKVKASINTASSLAENILRSVDDGEGKHMWAKNNDKGDKLIKHALALLRDALSPWHKDFMLTKNFAEFRKNYSNEKIITELTTFIQLADHVKTLETTCDKIVRGSEIMS